MHKMKKTISVNVPMKHQGKCDFCDFNCGIIFDAVRITRLVNGFADILRYSISMYKFGNRKVSQARKKQAKVD